MVDTIITKDKNGEVRENKIMLQLRFLDSFKFMAESLDNLTRNLTAEGKSVEKILNTKKYFPLDKMKLLMRKGVYPYEYMDSFGRFSETQLPPKEAFYSQLAGSGISDEDYERARRVWHDFNIKDLREFTELYVKLDVTLLADIFENFRDLCITHNKLDPAWYYTASGLSYDRMLKITKIILELLSDVDMLLMIERGTRGGISMISKRYAKANNPYMGERFDENEEKKYLQYLDANNLYGWGMSKKLPTHGFKWMIDEELRDWREYSCFWEVDLEYPRELHDLHNDYSLAPESVKINGVEKLIPNLNDKTNYVIHHENHKLYLDLGLKLKKIHRGIKFEESDWMKVYIDLNTELRARSSNDFEKDFFKLMNNSVFSKTMENLRNMVNIRLINNSEKAEKLVVKPNYKHRTDENLLAMHMRKTQILVNKPVYLGFSILEFSKTLMYDFHYNYIKPKYGDKAN